MAKRVPNFQLLLRGNCRRQVSAVIFPTYLSTSNVTEMRQTTKVYSGKVNRIE